ncbi:hypothetical protein VP01_546g4 [Puccinia sorghi]|uniref:Indoleamine 2,3-dioxygenase n=1 Tax=Puccinia sorghi TaxID=27349 RepID=A0A0L6UJL0_9BASI|nr:hypothetical protein VP01_546g4 [Puccinia sorghi]
MPSARLDPDHFLSPQKVFLGSTSSVPSSCISSIQVSPSAVCQVFFSSSNSTDTTTLASADFDVDVRSGFLSPLPPLPKISDTLYQPWEEALENITKLISKDSHQVSRHAEIAKWKKYIASELPLLNMDSLRNEIVELRRAHLVLAFLTHAFVHSLSFNQQPSLNHPQDVIIPLSLAIPLFGISRALDMPPVLTYADTVLYNWSFRDPALGFTSENIEIPTTFTRTDSERHFFKTSVLVEALGPGCLKLMRSSLDEAFMEDETSVKRIANNLGRLAKQIDRISQVLSEVRAGCDPRTFYWEIRPWFVGGRWKWEGVVSEESNQVMKQPLDEQSQWAVTDFGGPSAGQSTLIHAIDVFLGVDHHPNAQEITSGIHDEETFMQRMSTYMPHHHRLFLKQLYRACSTEPDHVNLIRSIVMNHQHQVFKSGPNNLKENYNLCIQSLENLRKTHTKIVSLFIICQKNSLPPSHPSALNSINPSPSTPNSDRESYHIKPHDSIHLTHQAEKSKQKNAEKLMASQSERCTENHHVDTIANLGQQLTEIGNEIQKDTILKGTGGTDLSKFLKRCKLRTTQAFLD